MNGETQSTDTAGRQRELAELKERVEKLETEISDTREVVPFQPPSYYLSYYATTGFFLGMFGAVTSLLFNVVGSLAVNQNALELIRVYLTFPLGDRALEFTPDNNGLVLAIGVCLYIGTGMLFGVPFYVLLVRFAGGKSLFFRFVVGTILAVGLWLVAGTLLAWLQPAMIDMSPENLIVNRVPASVALATHLVYGWTLVLVYPLGQFVPYQPVTEQQS